MAIRFSNNAQTTLASGITATATSISVVDGSVFPALTPGDHTYVTLEDTLGNLEIVKVTAISSNTLTVTRGQDGTTARAFSSGDFVQLRVTAALLNDLADEASVTLWADVQNKPDPVITLAGDATGSATLTDLGNATLTVTIADDSHSHVISNVDGLQAALDSKLAVSSYTAADVLAKLITVDGASSGLDADLLDGQHGSYYQPASTALTTSTTFGGDVSGTYNAIVVANNSHEHSQLYENSTITYGASYLQWTDLSGQNGTGANGNAPQNPTNDWYHHIIANHANGGGYYYDLSLPFHQDELFFRRVTNGSQGSFQKVWHGSNDGSGSGLDADLLDGVQGSSYLRSDQDDTFGGNLTVTGTISSGAITSTGTSTFAGIRLNNSNTAISQGSGNAVRITTNSGYIDVGPMNATYAHFQTDRDKFYFNQRVDFDGQIYNYVSGGTSDPYWRAGNDGSGSGLDADLLDGLNSSSFVRADASDTMVGHLQVRYNGVTTPPGYAQGQVELYTTSNYVPALGFHRAGYSATTLYENDGQLYVNPWVTRAQAGLLLSTGNVGTYAWTSSNDGSGSGLDADLLDGINSTGFMKQLSDSSTPNYTTPSSRRVDPNATNPTNAHHAIVTFGNDGNVTGQLATHYVTGQPYTRGFNAQWSAWQTIWTNVNDGSGSGLDADLLDGLNSDTSPAANTIVARNGSGHIYGNYILGNYFNATSGNSENPAIGQIWTQNTTDNYLRKSTPAHFISQLSLLTHQAGSRQSINFNNYLTQGFYNAANGNSNKPSGAVDYGQLIVAKGIDTGLQIYGGYSNSALYWRGWASSGSTLYSWHKVWDDQNDGSGSGLDADLLDGQHASAFEPVNATILHQGSDIGNQDWNTFIDGTEASWNTVLNHSGSNRPSSAYTYGTALSFSKSGQAKLQIYAPETSSAGGTSAGMWYRTGWNTGYRDWQRFWDSGNDGSGSGLDADLLDGLQGDFYFKSATNNNGGWSQSNRNFSVRTGGNAVGLHMEESDGTFGFQVYGDGSSYGFLDGEWGNWDLKKITNGELYVDVGSGLQKVWHAGNDGSGSGLDADLLDGKDHTKFGATLATYGTTAGASGRIRCTAPFNTNSAHMFQVTVSVYSSYTVHTYVVGGYMYPTTNQWYSPTVIYSGSGNPDIVVGRDSSGKAYISIANGNYAGVRVHNMTLGYQTSVADTYDPWTITINGATENSVTPTVAKTWTSVNDGSGSGLDADLLDGVQASQFLRSDTSNALGGDLTITNRAILSAATSNWTGNPGANGKIQYHANRWYIVTDSNSNRIVQFRVDGADKSYIDNNGTLIGGGMWSSYNDGSGSGLDADTCDGQHLGTTSNPTFNTVRTPGANAEVKFSVWSGTTYGIGMQSGVTYGGLNDYAMTFCMNNDSDRGFWWGYSGQAKSAGAMSLTTGGILTVASSITAGGNITAYSDRRLKEDLRPITDALSKVQKLSGNTYTRNDQKDTETRYAGLIAQECAAVLPESVKEADGGVLALDYNAITALLLESIRELKAEVDDLKAQLKEK